MLKKDVEQMKVAYGILYNLENSLRIYIEQMMQEYYGIHWNHVAPRKEHNSPHKISIDSLNFTDYTSYFNLYPKAFKSVLPKYSTYLRELYPIRNKIAHHHPLSNEEYQTLQLNADYLVNFIEEQLIIFN